MYKETTFGSFYRLDENEDGDYKNGKLRYSLLEAPNFVDTPNKEEANKFIELKNIEAAIDYFELTYSPKQQILSEVKICSDI